MNKRIKELFNQAGGQVAIHPLKYNGTLNVELFAELIVQECVEGIKRRGWYWNSNSVEELCDKIEEHFGVE